MWGGCILLCLTMYNLPWFMDLICNISMQCCSLQHQTLSSPPNTSTTEHHFRFGPAVWFFVELLVIVLCYFPVAYWTHFDLEGSSSRVISFVFSYCSWDTYCFSLFFSSAFFKFNFNWGKLLYRAVWASSIQQCESAITKHISSPSWASWAAPYPTPLHHQRASGLATCVI